MLKYIQTSCLCSFTDIYFVLLPSSTLLLLERMLFIHCFTTIRVVGWYQNWHIIDQGENNCIELIRGNSTHFCHTSSMHLIRLRVLWLFLSVCVCTCVCVSVCARMSACGCSLLTTMQSSLFAVHVLAKSLLWDLHKCSLLLTLTLMFPT